MPSAPESGPRMMSTLSCSISLRARASATSAWAFELSRMNSMRRPPTVWLMRSTLARAEEAAEPRSDADGAVGRDQHDDEEDRADERVEAVAVVDGGGEG